MTPMFRGLMMARLTLPSRLDANISTVL